MPPNLHKFANMVHWTLFPCYVDPNAVVKRLYVDVDANANAQNNALQLERAYLYTLSYLKSDDSYRNGTARAISIITRIPLFETLKPLLTFVLHQSFDLSGNSVILENLYNNLNGSALQQLYKYFTNLTLAQRFVLTRLPSSHKDKIKALNLSQDLAGQFIQTNQLYKTSISLGHFKFPIQISKQGLMANSLCMFGADLSKDCVLRTMLDFFNQSKVVLVGDSPESDVAPYADISVINILFNALLLGKKILLYSYNTTHNSVVDIACSLYLLAQSQENVIDDRLNFSFFPMLDLSTLDLVYNKDSFLVGTCNILLKEKLDWDLYYDFDDMRLIVKNKLNRIDAAYFDPTPSTSNKRLSVKSLFNSIGSGKSGNIDNYLNDSESIYLMSNSDPLFVDEKLKNWDSTLFPIIKDKINFSSDANSNSNSDLEDPTPLLNLSSSKYPALLGFNYAPRVDKNLTLQIDKIIKERHSDETIYILLTNYLRNFSTRILPAFYQFKTFLEIYQFSNEIGGSLTSDPNTTALIQSFIQRNNLVQALPLNYAYEQNQLLFDDAKLFTYNLKIVLSNVSLLRLAVHYNHHKGPFGNNSGYLFSWGSGKNNEIPLRLDTHYLIEFIDKIVRHDSQENWKIDKEILLQTFKCLNAILKHNSSNLSALLMDFFIEQQGNESFVNYKTATNHNRNTTMVNNNSNININATSNRILTKEEEIKLNAKLNRLAATASNAEFIKELLFEGTQVPFRTSMSSFTGFKYKSKNKPVNASIDNDDENDIISKVSTLGIERFNKLLIVTSLYININGPDDIVETTKGPRRKDLVHSEFKKFLSYILSDDFFKLYVLPGTNDFVKLTVNDFIDYHM